MKSNLMQQPIIRLLFLGMAVSIAGFVTLWQLAASQAQGGACTTGAYLEQALSTGARWDFCWTARTQEGIVLSEIYYTTPMGVRRKVLQEASLAQIEVNYDDGHAAFYYASTPGLGDAQLLMLSTADCPEGLLLSQGNRSLLCKQVAARGYLYKY